MAWHKRGNVYYSETEVRAEGNEWFHFLVDICLPGFVTYLGVTALSALLDHYHFFVVHTTTAKLTCILAGLFVFTIAYTVRRLVIALTALAIFGVIVLCLFGNFFHWLLV
jgi:hypothetical protein